jgi:phosphoheptose isomerase
MASNSRDTHGFVLTYLEELKSVVDRLPIDGIEKFIDKLSKAYQDSKQVFIVGNGGSAATASHMACDLAKTVLSPSPSQHRRFRAIALTDNIPLLTAWGNDANYDVIFAEQLRNLANAADLLIVITGSGTSANIVEAAKVAKELGLTSFGLLGFDGGVVKSLLDDYVIVPSNSYGHIEDVHMMLTHIVTAYFKSRIALAGINAR